MLKICSRFTLMLSMNCKEPSFGQITHYTMCPKFELKTGVTMEEHFSIFNQKVGLQILASPVILKIFCISASSISYFLMCLTLKLTLLSGGCTRLNRNVWHQGKIDAKYVPRVTHRTCYFHFYSNNDKVWCAPNLTLSCIFKLRCL